MSEMPERIWAYRWGIDGASTSWKETKPFGVYTGEATQYIRADIAALSSAAVAEREPVAWLAYWSGCGSINSWTVTTHLKDVAVAWKEEGAEITPLYLDPSPLSKLEAENERLRAERDEARQALEPFAAIEWSDEDGWSHDSPYRERVCDWFGPSDFRAARRVREGGQVE